MLRIGYILDISQRFSYQLSNHKSLSVASLQTSHFQISVPDDEVSTVLCSLNTRKLPARFISRNQDLNTHTARILLNIVLITVVAVFIKHTCGLDRLIQQVDSVGNIFHCLKHISDFLILLVYIRVIGIILDLAARFIPCALAFNQNISD